jgi:2-polyprenyl-3-methyl-5-hydroxy-6-metoxy-1,4-benzoquinol methylase
MTRRYYVSRDIGPSTDRDPDGRIRDLSTERAQKLEDLSEELRFINNLKHGAVLDIGCGYGHLLSAIDNRWEKHGIEPDLERWRIAQTACDHVFCMPVEEVTYSEGRFDCIVMYHVIEHLKVPEVAMAKVKKWLRPGGHFVIGTPDFDSECAKLWGSRYRMLHDPTHISLFSRTGLHEMLRDYGFWVDRVATPYWHTRHDKFDLNHVKNLKSFEWSPPWPGNIVTFYARRQET